MAQIAGPNDVSEKCPLNPGIVFRMWRLKYLPLESATRSSAYSFNRDAAVAIDLAAAKLQVEMMPFVIVCDRSQHPRFYLHPNSQFRSPLNPFLQLDSPERKRPFCGARLILSPYYSRLLGGSGDSRTCPAPNGPGQARLSRSLLR